MNLTGSNGLLTHILMQNINGPLKFILKYFCLKPQVQTVFSLTFQEGKVRYLKMSDLQYSFEQLIVSIVKSYLLT